MTRKVRVLITDAQGPIRQGLSVLLTLTPQVEVVASGLMPFSSLRLRLLCRGPQQVWRRTALGWSQFVESKINHPADDSERPLVYHISTVMCILHIDDT